MEIARNRIRRNFAPLNVSVAVVCDTPTSPLMQSYNASTGEYDPNRLLTPTVIKPIIMASAPDGSWPAAIANGSLSNIKWYVNNVDISTLADWTGLYTIAQYGNTRGAITISKNLTPGSVCTLRFEGNLVDARLGVTIPVVTEEVTMSTIDVASDNYTMSISADPIIKYNPFLDKLHLYDYKVAHGLIIASSAGEAEARDGNEYEKTIPLNVYKGGVKITSGFTVKLYKVNSASSITEITSSDYEVTLLSTSQIKFDLRLVSKADYMIKAFVNNEEVTRLQFSINRVYQNYTCKPTNETSILPDQTVRNDEVQVNSEGTKVECPGNIIKIVWFTTSTNLTDVQHNEGSTTVFQLDKTGIGKDYTNDWIDVFVTAEQKGAMEVAIDESSDILTDESNNVLIFN